MKVYKHGTQLFFLGLFVFFFLGGCTKRNSVDLEPNDQRPVISIQVSDNDEADLLIQQLKLELLHVDGNDLFFYQDAAQLNHIKNLGYEIKEQNSYEVFTRIVRINKQISETELIKLGIQTINREADHLIVKGTLSQLKSLPKRGVKISPLQGHEPRPRQIRMLVNSREAVAQIGALGIDIYSATRTKKTTGTSSDNNDRITIVVNAGAFDNQIDKLKAMGFEVEILPHPTMSPPSGEQS